MYLRVAQKLHFVVFLCRKEATLWENFKNAFLRFENCAALDVPPLASVLATD